MQLTKGTFGCLSIIKQPNTHTVMKKLLTILCAAFLACQANAQDVYPISGTFEQVAINCGNQRMTKIPQPVYKTHAGKYSMLVWVDKGTNLTWRMEEYPNSDDPFCQKIKDVTPESFVLTWYSAGQFWNFPARNWIDEEWKKVDSSNIEFQAISDALTHHNATGKLLGTWRLTAIRFPEKTGETVHMPKGLFKVYGQKHCILLRGSLYNIENAQPAMLRDFMWKSQNEFVENGIEHKIAFINPNKIIVEYIDENMGKAIETWVRYSVPEPAASAFSAFK